MPPWAWEVEASLRPLLYGLRRSWGPQTVLWDDPALRSGLDCPLAALLGSPMTHLQTQSRAEPEAQDQASPPPAAGVEGSGLVPALSPGLQGEDQSGSAEGQGCPLPPAPRAQCHPQL